MQDHSSVIKLVARLHEQKNEIENLQVSITALHKEKVILANSLKKERKKLEYFKFRVTAKIYRRYKYPTGESTFKISTKYRTNVAF